MNFHSKTHSTTNSQVDGRGSDRGEDHLRTVRLLGIAMAGLSLLVAVSVAAADEQPPSAHEAEVGALDSELLEGLDDLFEGLGEDASPEPAAADVDHEESTTGQLAPLRQDQEGEDIGPATDNPLVNIGRKMQTAQRRLQMPSTDEQTRLVQREIVHDLDQLIDQIQQQQPSDGESTSPTESQQAAAEESGTGDADAGQAGSESDEDRVAEAPPSEEFDAATMDRIMDDIWGHLPPRVRERVQSASGEQFLPKYEKLIEAYYKRLAEDAADGS